ncbi:PqiC family protein [Pseudoduganella sp. LjRoot289]
MRAGALASALLLAACGTAPVEHFYSLTAGAPLTAAGSAGSTGSAAGAPGAGGQQQMTAPVYIELQAVSVPQQVSRNQLVVTSGAGRVELLEQERWAAPLASEIGQALSLGITGELGAIDVYRTAAPEQATVYRVSTSVQRFESAPGQYALVDAVWSVRRVGSNKVLTCRSTADEKVAPGYDALVAGHRRAVARIAAGIAKAIRTINNGGSAAC